MGSAVPPQRLVPREVVAAVETLLSSATEAGGRIIDARAEAGRILLMLPNCGMTSTEIAEAIVQIGIRHPYVGLILSRGASEKRGGILAVRSVIFPPASPTAR